MNNAAFQLNKVRRLIRTQGRVFLFKKPDTNDFNEPMDRGISVPLMGVFHETTEYSSKTTEDASTTRQKSCPMVLMLWEDAKKLRHTDVLTFNGKPYRVNEIKNLCEANLVADIYLEGVQT